jgi:hypothetical protein
MLNGQFPANLFVHISAVERAGLSTLNEVQSQLRRNRKPGQSFREEPKDGLIKL